MNPPIAERRDLAVVVAIAVAVSLVVLGVRNLYEDEWVSLAMMSRPLAELWRWSLGVDIHPPGMYALDRALLAALHAPRAIGVVHLAVWTAGAAAFVAAAGRRLEGAWARRGFALVALLHPQVAMWNTSLRWYPVWWGIALAVLAAALLPGDADRPPGWGRVLAIDRKSVV